MIDKEANPPATGHDDPAIPEKWKAQRVFRERQRARLQTSEAQVQELHADLAAADRERVHLRAQVETLTQLVTRRGDGPACDRSGTADEELKLRALAADNARLRRELLASQQHAGGHDRVDQTGRSADAARIQLLEATVASLQGEQRPREGASLNGRTTEDQACTVPGSASAAFMRQKQELLRKASRKAPLTTQPTRCQYVKESESDHVAQKPIDLDDDLASAMAVLALSMRGPGAVGTTAMECRSVAPTTLHNILEEVAQHFRLLLELGAEVEGSPAAERLQQLFCTYWAMKRQLWLRAFPLLHGVVLWMFSTVGEPPPEVNARVLAAMALSEEQAEQACDRYEAMLAALEDLAAQQTAAFASRSPEFFPGPTWITTRAHECQKISHQLLDVLREFNLAWPERILHPVQFVRGIAEASPWIVNTIALSRDLAVQRGRVLADAGGMADVLTWLFNDGSSSMMGADAETMSLASLQDALPNVDDGSGHVLCPDSLEPGHYQAAMPP